jgi:enoyl-CoA hydratase
VSLAGLRAQDVGAVRTLTLCNPSRRNALDPALLEALAAELGRAETDRVRVLILRGEGGAFCAGYDLSALGAPEGDALPDDRLGEVLAMLEQHPAASIALVEGPAFGAGCELAATCDFRIGAPSALFCMPPARLGIVYAPAGIARLVDLVGLSRTRRMFLTATTVDAQLALAWGLLDALEDDAAAGATSLAEQIARNAPLAVQGTRKVLGALARRSLPEQEGRALRALRRQAFGSEDAKEGRAAFLEKRAPRFTGR